MSTRVRLITSRPTEIITIQKLWSLACARGRLQGEARTFLEDGTLISTPHMGTFTRHGSKACSYFTDATNQGVVNFVIWDIDIITKTVAVRYWEVKSP